MDPVYHTLLKIEHIDSKKMGLSNGDVWSFVMVSPKGWEEGSTVIVEENGKMKTSKARNVDKDQECTVFFEGNVMRMKSSKPSPEMKKSSLRKNIRLDKELVIEKIFPNHVIQLADGTKWQLNMVSGKGSSMEWEVGDTVVISKGAFPSPNMVKIKNKTQKQELSAVFISEE